MDNAQARLQKRVAFLQERYKTNPQQMHERIAKAYKNAGIRPPTGLERFVKAVISIWKTL